MFAYYVGCFITYRREALASIFLVAAVKFINCPNNYIALFTKLPQVFFPHGNLPLNAITLFIVIVKRRE